MDKSKLKQITPYVWEAPQSTRGDMRAPARVYATREMLDAVFGDRTLDQLVNVATLPGIQGRAMVMPDAHEGYGFPIGGVAATEYPDGVISPGGIGYDINCGVRLLRSTVSFDEIKDQIPTLAHQMNRAIPSGVGRGGRLKLKHRELDQVLREGAGWMVKQGFGSSEDLRHIESNGVLTDADPAAVSDHAKKRGLDQVGTMGAGNHFVEIDRIDEIYDETVAAAFGLRLNQVVILIHTGSRGLGHQVATDYIKRMVKKLPEYGIELPDRELACAPLSSPEGSAYFKAMCAAANFAWANRQMITHSIRESWSEVLGSGKGRLSVVYDVAHNIAKIEEHEIDGVKKKLIVHRKGATRAFPPGHPELASEYRALGQPVIIPGSMGTASYVLVGAEGSMRESFGSSCHGAGRRMSRRQAKRTVHGRELIHQLAGEGIHVEAGSISGVAEEAPLAYKDVAEVVDVVHGAGIARKVARLRPQAVIKG